jgi:hypothetical protein
MQEAVNREASDRYSPARQRPGDRSTPYYSLGLWLPAGRRGTAGIKSSGVIMSQSQRMFSLPAAVHSSERLFDFFFGEKLG